VQSRDGQLALQVHGGAQQEQLPAGGADGSVARMKQAMPLRVPVTPVISRKRGGFGVI
jgi:hypothetical protein